MKENAKAFWIIKLREAYINQVRRTSDIMHYAFYIMHSVTCIVLHSFLIVKKALYFFVAVC
jgi:hypothetical protein